jgi:hypothetical protein
MSEPIPDVAGIPDVEAARALLALIELLYTDPLARPLLPTGGRVPMYIVRAGGLSIRYADREAGVEQLNAATALFGGTVIPGTAYDHETEGRILTTTWREVPLRITVEVKREDELAALRKQAAAQAAELAELKAAAGLVVAE